jgi:integrase
MRHKSAHTKLSDEVVLKKRCASDTAVFIRDTVTSGFAIKIYPSGRKSFIAERRLGDTDAVKRVTIGTFPELSVEEARAKALDIRRTLAQGSHPKEAGKLKAVKENETKRANSKEEDKEKLLNMTVFQLLEDVYLSGDEKFKRTRTLKRTTVKDVRGVWQAHLKEWRHESIRALTPRKIKELYQDIAINKEAPSQAEKFRKYLNASFNVLINEWNRDYPEDELFPGNFNPAEVGLKGEKVKAPIKEKVWLTQIQLVKTRSWFEVTQSSSFELMRSQQFYTMLMQYGLRKSEALGLLWDDVDFADGEGTGTLAFRDTKKGNDHILPLSKPMHYSLADWKDITKACYPDDDLVWVFRNDDNTRPLTTNPRYALRKLNEMAGINFSCHDIRRSFNKWVESPDILNQDKVVAERLLNQEPSGVNERFYQDIKPMDYRFLYDQIAWYWYTGIIFKREDVEKLSYWQMLDLAGKVTKEAHRHLGLKTIKADPLKGISPELKKIAESYSQENKDAKRLT